MTDDIITELEKKDQSELHKALLEHAKCRIKRSRSRMSEYYPQWDSQDSIFRGEVDIDAANKELARKGKPIKMVVPNTYAQCMTFTSFLFLMFNQNRTFFELSPSGDEDAGTKRKDCEQAIERDLRKNQWNLQLFQHLLDIPKFGVGILENSWTREVTNAMVMPEASIDGVQVGPSWQEFLKYEGNLIRNVSPYRFFPDTNFPLTDFQKGEFCAAEEEYTMGALYDLQSLGEVAGVEHIQPLATDMDSERGAQTRSSVLNGTSDFVRKGEFDSQNKAHNVLVTKIQIKIVPGKFTYGSKKDTLGKEEFPILYHLWYANDNRVIRFEQAGNWHGEFGWTVAQFTPDMHRTINLGLADLISSLQEVISWFVNSHITSVRRVMSNRLIVNPRVVDPVSLDGEKDIYLRKGVSIPLDSAVSQLKVQDVTGQHMNDVDMLGKIMEQVTGVNGNAMGQYNSGRRSAQEARVVTAGAAGRMKLHGHLIWESSLGRLGRLMLSNLRQQLSFESFQWVVGKGKDDAPSMDPMSGMPMPGKTAEQKMQERFDAFKGTPEEVICGDDFMVFDSTLASEKGFMAQAIQELFGIIMQTNPMAAQMLTQKVDPSKLLDEMFYLRGSGNVSRFAYDVETAKPPVQMPQPPAAPTV